MSKDATGTMDPNVLGAAIAAGIKLGIAEINKPEMREGDPEYTARLKAEGFFDEFEKPVVQNGYSAQARGLSEQTRMRASNLKSGKYLGGRVSVEADGHRIYINYPTSKVDDRFKNMTLFTSFEDLIDKIWAEMHQATAAVA